MYRTHFVLLIIMCVAMSYLHASDIKKWTDKNGKVHYGDIIGDSHKAEILDINDPAPEITEGEQLMRMKNDLYYEELELKRREKRLSAIEAAEKRQHKKQKETNKVEKTLARNRRACIKAQLKIEDIKDDLRNGYTTKRGIQLENKRRKQQRRVDAYC